jgi:hypothetical protein
MDRIYRIKEFKKLPTKNKKQATEYAEVTEKNHTSLISVCSVIFVADVFSFH